jgi:Zn finger protein HypA/HybF involved in hydrogenase expression
MHDGCGGSFESGQQVVDKVRTMGFAEQALPMPLEIKCEECGTDFAMETFEAKCPKCETVYGVTPCHAFDAANVATAGKNY